jgi:DNA-binding transcriptional regulator GbsR (MarR family)
LEGRTRRELDPTLTTLREFVLKSADDDTTNPAVKARIHDTLEFMEQLTGWYGQMKELDRATLLRVLKLGAKVQALLGKHS